MTECTKLSQQSQYSVTRYQSSRLSHTAASVWMAGVRCVPVYYYQTRSAASAILLVTGFFPCCEIFASPILAPLYLGARGHMYPIASPKLRLCLLQLGTSRKTKEQ